MKNFLIEKHGYSVSEVDDYINRREAEVRRTMDDQLDRIRAQREEIDKLKKELDEYISKEKMITHALISAGEKAQEIAGAAKAHVDLEIEALHYFHEQWVAYFQAVANLYPYDSTLTDVEKVYQRIVQALKEGELDTQVEDIVAKVILEDDDDNIEKKESKSEEKLTKKAISKAVDAHIAGQKSTTNNENVNNDDKTKIIKKSETDNSQTEQFNEESQRLGVNMSAVSDVLSDAGMADSRYDRIASNWGEVPPRQIQEYLDSERERKRRSGINASVVVSGAIDPRTGVAAGMLSGMDGEFNFDEALNPQDDLGNIMADLINVESQVQSGKVVKGKKK